MIVTIIIARLGLTPPGPSSGSLRVGRGGNYSYIARYVQSAARFPRLYLRPKPRLWRAPFLRIR